jgi:hypothetical protein
MSNEKGRQGSEGHGETETASHTRTDTGNTNTAEVKGEISKESFVSNTRPPPPSPHRGGGKGDKEE